MISPMISRHVSSRRPLRPTLASARRSPRAIFSSTGFFGLAGHLAARREAAVDC